MMKATPTAAEAYGILLQEQVHQVISIPESEDITPMACRIEKRKFQDFKNKNKGEFRNKKPNSNLFIDHCKIPGHNMEKCYKLHGYPPRNKSNSWRRDS